MCTSSARTPRQWWGRLVKDTFTMCPFHGVMRISVMCATLSSRGKRTFRMWKGRHCSTKGTMQGLHLPGGCKVPKSPSIVLLVPVS